MNLFKVFIMTFVMGGMLSSCQKNEEVSPNNLSTSSIINDNEYIIELKPTMYVASSRKESITYEESVETLKTQTNNFLAQKDIHSFISYQFGNSFVTTLSPQELSLLNNDPRVLSINPNKMVALDKIEIQSTNYATTTSTQNTSWSIRRVGGSSDASNKVVYVLDSGVDFTHPDLNVNQTLSRSFVNNEPSANDENGHGTHVAGIIAAKNNDFGVSGIAANATVIAVKVVDKNGNGSDASILAGLYYIDAIGKAGQVVNISLVSEASIAIDNLVKKLAQKGMFISIAAGNNAKSAATLSPARVNGTNIYTVSACDVNDKLASYSNYGNPPVDYAEPGQNILSCYKDGRYATMSGTSMAAPHLSGILLLNNGYVKNGGSLKADKDGIPDVIGKK